MLKFLFCMYYVIVPKCLKSGFYIEIWFHMDPLSIQNVIVAIKMVHFKIITKHSLCGLCYST